MCKIHLLLILLVALMCGLFPRFGATAVAADQPSAPSPPPETAAHRDARLAWWREARFGMFIHWGLYALPAGRWKGKPVEGIGEWIMHNAKIPVADYAALADQFNPTKFDAAAWADIAKAAGMKYVVITAKHHDGFAMYHSGVDGFNIFDATPFKRDPVRELADACAQRGLKFGIYYSQCQDWHHPGGAAAGGRWEKAQDGDYDAYLHTIALPQVSELLKNYDPAILWFDTPMDLSPERVDPFVKLLKAEPSLIFNDRLGNNISGHFETPEQKIPAQGFPGHDWETCMTINDTWGYKSDDNNFKSAKTLIRDLADIAGKGGNLLLNVGPTAEGVIPAAETERLKQIGAWLTVNAESIYGATASPFRKPFAWGCCTQKATRLYLHVFDWPREGTLVVPIANPPFKAYFLAHPDRPLTFRATPEDVRINLPTLIPDTNDTVVVLEFEGIISPIEPSIPQARDGSIQLAEEAKIVGETAHLMQGNAIGFWFNANDYVEWKVKIERPGTFLPELNYALDPKSNGSEITLTAGDQSVNLKLVPTSSWGIYASLKFPAIKIEKPGDVVFTVKAAKKPGEAVMNLKLIALKPVR